MPKPPAPTQVNFAAVLVSALLLAGCAARPTAWPTAPPDGPDINAADWNRRLQEMERDATAWSRLLKIPNPTD
jgi:hypothetical protein